MYDELTKNMSLTLTLRMTNFRGRAKLSQGRIFSEKRKCGFLKRVQRY